MRIGIISNPFAKMNKKDPQHNTRLWYILGNHGQLEVTRSISELESVCQEFQARDINFVGIVGGDGSIGLVLSYLYKAYGPANLPKILILKGGTINFLAANLRLPVDGLDHLQKTLKCLQQQKPLHEVRLSTIRIGERLGFIFANGAASHFLQEYYKNKTGPLGAAVQVGQTILDGFLHGKWNGTFHKIVKKSPVKFNQKFYPDHVLTFASTLSELPFGVPLFQKVRHGQKHFEYALVTGEAHTLLQETVVNFFKGKLHQSAFLSSDLAENIVIETFDSTPYSLDGDLISPVNGKICIETGPQFTFCSPCQIRVKER